MVFFKPKTKLAILIFSLALSMPSLAASFTETQSLANQGYAKAQYNLGVMYDNGLGVPQDYQSAKILFSESCDNGSSKGCDYYRILNEESF